MTIQIAIIGLGQIGASIGLALSSKEDLIRRIGYDRDMNVARQAERMGALDRVVNNLPTAVRDSDIVIISVPMDQIRETLAVIAMNLKNNGIVMETGPVKEAVTTWASELLPSNRHYIGLTPVLNPAYLHGTDSGVSAARADLFRGGVMAIVTPHRASSEAVKMAADLTRILGATPLFVDPIEIDSLMAATHILPQLLAGALLNATADQPGWREGRKIAGRAYAEATGPIVHLDDAHTLRVSVLHNRQNMLRVLDGTIAALQTLRADIDTEDADALEERLERARASRERWWRQRQAAEWTGPDTMPTTELPKSSDVFGRLLGFSGRKTKPKK
jgi:prephenate dehydrogenase